MTENDPVWNLTPSQWQTIIVRSQSAGDVLEDGAYVRYDAPSEELHFFATPLRKPAGWQYPFLETVTETQQKGAFIGRVWHDKGTGFVDFEVILYAAAQALRADYESDVSDLDYVTYEQAVEQAVRGSAADLAWLHQEFGRLAILAEGI